MLSPAITSVPLKDITTSDELNVSAVKYELKSWSPVLVPDRLDAAIVPEKS